MLRFMLNVQIYVSSFLFYLSVGYFFVLQTPQIKYSVILAMVQPNILYVLYYMVSKYIPCK